MMRHKLLRILDTKSKEFISPLKPFCSSTNSIYVKDNYLSLLDPLTEQLEDHLDSIAGNTTQTKGIVEAIDEVMLALATDFPHQFP